jgi:hypothetical protein
VCPTDGFQIPIGPKDVVIKDGDGKDVRDFQRVLNDIASIATVQIRVGDVIKMSISPE